MNLLSKHTLDEAKNQKGIQLLPYSQVPEIFRKWHYTKPEWEYWQHAFSMGPRRCSARNTVSSEFYCVVLGIPHLHFCAITKFPYCLFLFIHKPTACVRLVYQIIANSSAVHPQVTIISWNLGVTNA